jgi:hypothetical protein
MWVSNRTPYLQRPTEELYQFVSMNSVEESGVFVNGDLPTVPATKKQGCMQTFEKFLADTQFGLKHEPRSRPSSWLMLLESLLAGRATKAKQSKAYHLNPYIFGLIRKDDNDDFPHTVGADANGAMLASSAEEATSQRRAESVGGGSSTTMGKYDIDNSSF